LSKQPLFCQADRMNLPNAELLTGSCQSTDGQFEETIFARQSGKDMDTEWQIFDRHQSSGSASPRYVSYQESEKQVKTYGASTPHDSLTYALLKFGIPCMDARHTLGTLQGVSLQSFGEVWGSKCDDENQRSATHFSANQPSDWSLFSHSWGWESEGEINQCVAQREALGTSPFTNWVGEILDAPKASTPMQGCEDLFMASSCIGSQNANPKVAQIPLVTAETSPGTHLTSPQAPRARQSEHCEAARLRRSIDAMAGKTTLVVRNIPARYSQRDILKHWWVPDGTFNLLFLPHSFKLGHTVGYAIINFVSSADAQAFHNQWHGRQFTSGNKVKPLDIHASRLQGLYDNLKYLSTSEVMRIKNSKFHPGVFNGASRINLMDALLDLGLLGQEQQTA